MANLYSYPRLYRLLIRTLYGPDFNERYAVVSKLIPEGAQVLDVCCGDAYIYSRFLKKKNVRYQGLDRSAAFERYAQKRNIPFRKWDGLRENLPEADYILLMGSLYQWIPHHEDFLRKLIRAAGKCLIIVEPVRNLAQSGCRLVRWGAQKATYPHGQRFDEARLVELFTRHHASRWFKIGTGREIAGVFDCPGKGG